MSDEQIVVSDKADPERYYAEIRGLATITFNGSETDDEITVTVDSDIGLWQDSVEDPRVLVGQPIVRSAGSPASNSDKVLAVKVSAITITSGVLTFKIKAWINTATGGSTAADIIYLDFPYQILGDISDEGL